MGGKLAVLNQPFELVIIFGSAIMAYLVANSVHTVKQSLTDLKQIYKKDKYGKDEYMELLSMMYSVFKMARTKGWLALENHIENPEDSEIFQQFTTFYNDKRAVTFVCDYLRIISLGSETRTNLKP